MQCKKGFIVNVLLYLLTSARLLTVVFLMCCALNAVAGVKISGEFAGATNVKEVEVTLPVGNYINNFSKTYYPVTNCKFSFEFNVTAYVAIQIRTGHQRIFVLAGPGDNISIKLFDTMDKYKALKFEGSNAAGLYWYNVYNYAPLANVIRHGVLFDALSSKTKDGTLNKLGLFFLQQTKPLDSLLAAGQINAAFLSLAKTDIRAHHVEDIRRRLTGLQAKITNQQDINKYEAIKNALGKFGGPNKVENTRTAFGAGFLMDYYSELALNEGKPGSTEWGPYAAYKLAPDTIRMFLLGDALLFSKTEDAKELNFPQAFALYKKEFPKSPYLALLNKLQMSVAAVGDNQKPVLDSVPRYKTLTDLRQHFKGKPVYIDLWATWCVPCKMEFSYYQRLRPVFQRKNITSVFISIDEAAARNAWKTTIGQNQLGGTHILVSKALMADIEKVVYKGGQVSIPRYILIDKAGKVISLDAPRPSNPDLLTLIDKL